MSAAMNARDAILGSVRNALRRGPLDDARRAELDARRPRHTRPAQDEDLVARFVRKFESRAGTTQRVASRADVPAAVEAYRTAMGLPARAVVGAALQDLSWPAGLEVHHGAAGISETMSVSQALAGIAEPGSLMMASGPASPITHNFVPDDHVVVLDAGAIVGHFEEAWEILRARPEGMPRATNIISGPSRTADVEQTIQLGAHGPRRVHVILVG
ncbi:Lactate utilization protein C [Azoarcus sp. Aa7]|nr:Lactate utilization protein C [Azoarcus sp. Aa7]